MTRRSTVAAVLALLLVGSCLCLCFLFKSWEQKSMLRFAPTGFGISKISYSKEESWGFGPGGNETGVIVYEISDATASRILRNGIDPLSGRPEENAAPINDRQRSDDRWVATPVLLEGTGDDTNTTNSYKIADYLNRYGFGISIDSKLAQEINTAISTPGSFVAKDRNGICIVIPKKMKVVYAYRG